ncbi:prolyl oligopeptidase family serine peptidase [Aliivibrio fischeri]|uniref:S9 family peptidase n=1 Tax=Aliivibrio fischeri TaxID=668 RepID=UPI0012D99BBF|nr:S9 family peptidase [Aliivibrio fischeri]MUK28743.1 prolyl oligopeptidase family serine peptidase [Aliivibrio fischeri]
MINKLNPQMLIIILSLGVVTTYSNAANNDRYSIKQCYEDIKKHDAIDFFETTTYMGSSFSPDNKSILLGSDKNGIFNLYEIDVNTGKESILTKFKSTTYPVSWFPNDKRILFTQDNSGNELYRLFIRETNGTITTLTNTENTRANFINFTNDGTFFYMTTNERDSQFMDLYRYNSDTYERSLVFENKHGFEIIDVSGDGRFVSLFKSISNKNSNTYILDLKNTTLKPILINDQKQLANYTPKTFSKDSKKLYYSTDSNSEFSQIWEYDIKSKKHNLIIKDNWDVNFIYFSKSGKYQVSGVNANSRTRITISDTTSGKKIIFPHNLPKGDIHSINFSRDEKTLSFYINSDISPSDLFVWNINKNSVKQLTQSLNSYINPKDLVNSKTVYFKSFDEVIIPGLLFKPKRNTTKHPAIIYVHGGPGGQSRKGYNPIFQHLINNGYAIFAVNNRGSSGYGKTFFHLDDKKHGEDDLKDIIYGKKYLESLDWIDSNKIGIMGDSYGGYMSVAALTFYPEEFDIGINIFGVTNWVRTLNSIPPWWEPFKKALYDEMGDPATDGKRHKAISPLFHTKNISRPLMVIQGANDPRVLKVESDELVENVKKNGTPIKYIVFNDEGHGFTKKSNRIKASKAYADFLNHYLPPLESKNCKL